MWAICSVGVQLVAFAAGVYLAVVGHIGRGIGLFLAVQVMHFLSTKASNGLMILHQRSLNPWRRAIVENDILTRAKAPAAWGWIATGMAAVFIVLSLVAIGVAINLP